MKTRKLTLDLDALSVQSFATGGEARDRGTVEGNQKLPCTGGTTCACASGYWACTTSRQTQQSCDWTRAGNTCDSYPTEVDPTCMC